MAEQRVQRRLAAILVADVVGYSRLVEADEEGTRTRLRSLQFELIEPRIAADGGRIVKTMGDGILVEFPSAVDAVRNALAIQTSMVGRDANLPEDRRIQFRVGINVGDVIVAGDDIHGDGVHVASRLEGLCGPGEVYVSGTVYDQVAGKLAASFEDLGEQRVKNIAKPFRAYRVLPVSETVTTAPVASDVDKMFDRPALAVLPFENMSGDPEQEYFSDGLTEDIITALSLWRSFPVIARNSTFSYKGTSPDVRKVGEELGARYVVEGSVRKAGNRVRVSAQLLNAETGHHIWAESYDRDLDDIFALQDEITRQIATIIEPAIERSEHKRITTKPASDLAAWEFCVRGYAHIYELTREANDKAREMFQRAIDLDPQYCRAHTGLAFTYGRDLRFFDTPDRQEWHRLGLESAQRAVALDETDADARTMLARCYNMTRRTDDAIAEAERAVQLNPHNADANNIMGAALSITSARYEEGIPWFERALQLNPSDPQHQVFAVQLALAHLGAGRYEEAIRHARDAIRRQPDFLEGVAALAASLGYLGRDEEARAAIEGHEDAVPSFVKRHVLYAPELKDCLLEGLRKAGLPE